MANSVKIAAAVLILGAAACAGSSAEQKKAEAAPAVDYEAQSNKFEAQAQLAQNELNTTKAKLEASEAQLAEVTKARDELAAQAAALDEQKGAAEAKSAQYESLASSLEKEIAAGQIELTELRGRTTVKLKDKVLFSSGSAKLNKEGKTALDAVAAALKDLKEKNILVAGYTDDVKVAKGLPFQDNWDLSTARAVVVVRYLESKGVPPELMAAGGFSQFRPIAPNDTPANRSINRRIEIVLIPVDYVPQDKP
jgi:chemotaxis protein MotB